MVDNKDKNEEYRMKYDLSFSKRPAFELYDLKKDPDQLHNIAASPDNSEVLNQLRATLETTLKATHDPRILGKGAEAFDRPKYLGGAPKFPAARKTRKKRSK